MPWSRWQTLRVVGLLLVLFSAPGRGTPQPAAEWERRMRLHAAFCQTSDGDDTVVYISDAPSLNAYEWKAKADTYRAWLCSVLSGAPCLWSGDDRDVLHCEADVVCTAGALRECTPPPGRSGACRTHTTYARARASTREHHRAPTPSPPLARTPPAPASNMRGGSQGSDIGSAESTDEEVVSDDGGASDSSQESLEWPGLQPETLWHCRAADTVHTGQEVSQACHQYRGGENFVREQVRGKYFAFQFGDEIFPTKPPKPPRDHLWLHGTGCRGPRPTQGPFSTNEGT